MHHPNTIAFFETQSNLGSSYLPDDVLDAYFISSLVVVVEPFAVSEFNLSELGFGIDGVR